MFKKMLPCPSSGYKTLRDDSEATLLDLGIQAGAVSHHAKNWCAVWNFHGGRGVHTAVLVDCGRVSLSPKVATMTTQNVHRDHLGSFVPGAS